MVSALESCYATSQDYSSCDTSQDVVASGIPTGTGNNQVNLATLASGNYQIVAKSASGNNFTVTHPTTGNVTRTCTDHQQGRVPFVGQLVSRRSGRMPERSHHVLKGSRGDCRSMSANGQMPRLSAAAGTRPSRPSPQKEETYAAEAE